MKLLIIVIILLTSTPTRQTENVYPMTTVVTYVDYATDIVTLSDFNGFEWQFTGTEDWSKGDICSCIMSDNGTPLIFDDEIIKVKYDGWFSGWTETE